MKKVMFILFFAVLVIGGMIATLPPRTALHGPTAALQPTITPYPTLTPSPTNTPETTCIVTADALHVRQCAGVGCAVVGSLKRSEIVKIEQKSGSWVRISVNSWVNSAFLTCGGAK